jgi:hypothetical protein
MRLPTEVPNQVVIRRFWYECQCGVKGPESLDLYWADVEASKHMLPFRLTEQYLKHGTYISHRDVIVSVG